MLVLSRQRDQSIVIGDNVVVTIVDIRGDKVRIGVNAPEEIPVHRQEVYDAIQRENKLQIPRIQNTNSLTPYADLKKYLEGGIEKFNQLYPLSKADDNTKCQELLKGLAKLLEE